MREESKKIQNNKSYNWENNNNKHTQGIWS